MKNVFANIVRRGRMRHNWKSVMFLVFFSSISGCGGGGLDDFLGPQNGDVGKNALLFSPESVNFGNSSLSPSYVDASVTITNGAPIAVYISSYVMSNTEFTQVSSDCPQSPLPIDAGSTCTMTLRFSPTSEGDRSGTLRIIYGSTAADSAAYSSDLGLAGRSQTAGVGNPGLSFNPSPYDYGDVNVSPSFSDRSFVVTNTTSDRVFISGFSTNSSVFSVTSTNCPISPQPLAASATCTVVARLTPPTEGDFTGALIATYGLSDLTPGVLNARVELSGRTPDVPITNPAITFTPDYWDFGDQALASNSEKTFTVQNTSAATVYVSSFAPSGDSHANFSILSNNCPIGLNPFAANATCSIIIRYTPTVSSAVSAKIVASYGPTVATNTTLSNRFVVVGRSSPPPISSTAISFNPTFWDYGDVANNQSVGKQITLTNSSTSTIYIGSIDRTSTAYFALSNINCPILGSGLAASASCQVNMIFTPTADGSYSSDMLVNYGPSVGQATSVQTKMVLIGRSTSSTIGNTALTFSPSFFDFDDKPVGSATNQTITVTNPSGNPPIYIGGVNIPATGNTTDFSVFGSTCPTGATTLAANSSCQFTLRYSPQATGFDSTDVQVQYGLDQARNTNFSSKMTGAGRSTNGLIGNEAFTFSPTYYDFGDVAANVTVQTTITMTNTPGGSAAPVYISNITRTTPSLFGVSHDCPVSPSALAVGSSCNITVTFRPTADGVQNSIISIVYGPTSLNSNVNTATMAVSGRSTAAANGNPSLSFNPDFWDYGDVPRNTNSDRVFQVTNNSSSPVYISTANLDVTGSFLITANSCPSGASSLGASASCNITLRFTPTADTVEDANLRVYYGPDQARSGNLIAKVAVAGRSVAVPPGQPIFTTTPSFHDYSDVAQGNSVQQAFTLTNASTGSVYISNITRSNTAVFSITHDCPLSPTAFTASATCTVTATFTPNAEGAHSTRFDVIHGLASASSTNLTYSFYAQGRSTAAATGNTALTFTPSFHDFGDVASGQTATQSVTITNSGATAVNMGTAAMTNALFSTTANTCPTGATQLAANATCTITARFSPTADGGQTGFMTYTYGPDQARSGNLIARMPVAGRSTAAPLGNTSITYSPTFWDFGDVAQGQSPTRNFTITNTYSSPLHISGISSSSARFTVSDDCPRSPSTIAASGTCTLTVTFSPNADGAFTGDITLAYGPDAPRSTNLNAMLSVAGRSTANPTGNPAIAFSPSYHDFGNIAVSANSSNLFTVQNTKTDPIYIGSAATSSAKYTITANTCPSGATPLAGSSSCAITVQYAPTTEVTDIETLTVSYGPDQARNTNLAAVATLIGKSEPPPVGNAAVTLSPNTYDFGNVALSPAFSDQVITVTNTTTRDLYFGAMSGLSAPYSVQSTTCPSGATVLAGSATCTITVRFSPIAGPQVSQTLTVNYGTTQGGNSDYNSQAQFTGRSSPNAPTNFQYTTGNGTSVTFTWDANDFDQASFEVQRCDGAACSTTWTTADTVTGILNTDRTYTASGLTAGNIYRFRIRGIAGATQSSWLTGSQILAFGGVTSVDNSTGSETSLTNINCNSSNMTGPYVGLYWTSAANAAYYQVFDTESGSPVFVKNVDAPASSTVITGLTAGQNKTYLVKAFTTSGVGSVNTTGSALTTISYSPCAVIGQTAPANWDMAAALNTPRAIAFSGSKMIVADQTNHRVLIWNSIPSSNNTPADVVLGQPDMTGRHANNSGVNSGSAVRSSKSLNQPTGVAVQGSKLIVSDYGNHRVLVWNSIPTSNFAAADYVLGQTDFVSATNIQTTNCALAARTHGRGMSNPEGVHVDSDGYLYVADRGNNRVLVYTSAITQSQQQANYVLGQASLTGNCPAAGLTQSTFDEPSQIAVSGNNIYIADRDNHRVMRFDKSSLANGMNANGIIGQINYTSEAVGGCNARGLSSPYGVWTDSPTAATSVYVADYANHRVLRFAVADFDSTPVNPAPDAENAIGQTNLTTCTNNNHAQAGTNGPIAGYAENSADPEAGVWVLGHSHHRITHYGFTAANSNGPSSDILLGQPIYGVNRTLAGGLSSTRLVRPSGVAIGTTGGNTRMAVVDSGASRVLLYDSSPTANNPVPSRVLGQSGFTAGAVNRGGSASSNTMNLPVGVWTNGNRLIVADTGNHRLLGWRNWPTSDGQAADFVVGQTDMTTVTGNNGSNRLNSPYTVFASPVPSATADDNYIWVADRANHRVVAYQVLWRTTPLDPPAAAMSHFFVLGQTTLTGNTNTTTQNGLNAPRGVWSDGSMVVVADSGNNRVLIWNSVNTASLGPNADIVLGQPDFTTSTANNGGLSSSSLDLPTAVWVDGTRLFVVDAGNQRILVWNTIPTTDNQPADRVIGQANFLTNAVNGGFSYPTAYLFNYPSYIWMDAGRLFIPDGLRFADYNTSTNNRVLIIPSFSSF